MSYQPDAARDTLLSGSTNKNVHLSNMSNRVNSQNRIISPTSSCNNYPHLRAENSVFNSKKSGYGIIPESYGGNSQAGPHTRQDPVIKKKPANCCGLALDSLVELFFYEYLLATLLHCW